jgi:hypothetical protein
VAACSLALLLGATQRVRANREPPVDVATHDLLRASIADGNMHEYFAWLAEKEIRVVDDHKRPRLVEKGRSDSGRLTS